MIVPEYWSEAKVRETINGSQVTIMRFGWSDTSEDDARELAQARAGEAMERARQGEKVRKRDHKTSYNGAEGLPIREEVIARHEDVVITRNVYGALCLNTPDVLFADIDFEEGPTMKFSLRVFIVLMIAAGMVGYFSGSIPLFIVLSLVALIFTFAIAGLAHRLIQQRKGGAEEVAKKVIEDFIEHHPESHLRLYRTPMGFRVLAMHTTFDPGAESTARLLRDLDTDPIYAQMCRNQKCFRARISPKPWRIGMERLGPRPGVWPIRKERMPARARWVEKYTDKARNFAACRFVADYGTHVTDSRAGLVRDLHDRYCMADKDMEIA